MRSAAYILPAKQRKKGVSIYKGNKQIRTTYILANTKVEQVRTQN
jgi:hypothetical protein